MNIDINSIYQSKLNEIQSRIPNISNPSSNFSECLKKVTNDSKSTQTDKVQESSDNLRVSSKDALNLLSLLYTTSMTNSTTSLLSGNSDTNSLSNLNTLLTLQKSNLFK